MKNIMKRAFVYVPFLLCLAILISIPSYSSFALRNFAIQILLFIFVACIPAYFTNKMSYVDVAWPWGLVALGVQGFIYEQGLVYEDGFPTRQIIISSIFLFMGLRMGLMSLLMLKPGVLKKDLPRYQFQRIQWKLQGFTNEKFSLQYEILIQGIANASILALPLILQLFNQSKSISILEILGYCLWGLSFLFEFLSDWQKFQFIKKSKLDQKKNQICNVGLWKYSRHPNYFFEWMVWNSLILSSIPSLINLFQDLPIYLVIGVGIFLIFISRLMYNTLVHYTGARPAEYYSVKKRPEYRQYQKTTNMFFPGPVKTVQ